MEEQLDRIEEKLDKVLKGKTVTPDSPIMKHLHALFEGQGSMRPTPHSTMGEIYKKYFESK